MISVETIGAESRLLWRGLLCNVMAGIRLALGMRVSVSQFRVSAAHLLVLLAFNLLVWFFSDVLMVGPSGELHPASLTMLLAQVAVLLLASTLIAGLAGRADLALQLPIMWSASDVLFEVILLAEGVLGFTENQVFSPEVATGLALLMVLWPLFVVLRAVVIAIPVRRWPAVPALLLTVALFWTLTTLLPRPDLWQVPGRGLQSAGSGIEQEALFHRQPYLLEQALERLAGTRSNASELFFLGVSPFASQDVFLREMRSVARILERRFAIADRSVLLINNRTTLANFPIATATNLRVALSRFGERMDVEKDVLLLFLTTHGEQSNELVFDLPPLALEPLRPNDLAEMLDESGIRWRVVVISACYSGGFVEALKNPYTVVITASDANSTSFGCTHENEWTYFGEAYFNEGMEQTPSFVEAFDIARNAVAQREKAGRLDPSNPQMFVGEAIRERLDVLTRKWTEVK
jgi:Peptidase C13 family